MPDHAGAVGTAEFLQRVRSLGPWWFRFEVDGHSFGGEVPRDTDKTELFLAWVERLGGGMATALELGSHEGSHTLQLARHPSVKRVVGLEGRADNVARANFVKSVYGCDNAEFHQVNLEAFEPSRWDGFDAVFCAGLLYHLPKPWELVEKMAQVCRRYLFLDTHYAQDERVLVERYAGWWYDENTAEPLSGLSNRSFWLSFKDLVLLLMESGFVIRFVRDDEGFSVGPRAYLIAERVEAVGIDWSKTQHGDGGAPGESGPVVAEGQGGQNGTRV